MDSLAKEKENAIAVWLENTASSLKKSFQNYWPSDIAGRNDPCEQNVTIHFANVLLQNKFSVFAEATHPAESIGRIDLLALASELDWFLAVEFKKIWSGTRDALIADLQRLDNFWLSDFEPERFCQRRIDTISKCERGIGIVAGLLWVPQSGKSSILQLWNSQGEDGSTIYADQIRKTTNRLNCIWPKPVLAWDESDGSKYYLLALAFDIPKKQTP